MAENSVSKGELKAEEANEPDVQEDAGSKPLKMSFADWKKSKGSKEQPKQQPDEQPETRNGRKPQKHDSKHMAHSRHHNNPHSHNNNNNGNNNNNNLFPPLNRPPPMPFSLLSMGFGNGPFGPGPGPCGPCGPPPPPPMMPPNCNMGNMGPGPGPGPGPRHHRPLQPPPFWEDMMSPQLRTPPIQPPMPKCPSLWNLVPKDRGNQQRSNKKPHSQLNQPKKYKSNDNSHSNNHSSTSTSSSSSNNSNNCSTDTALMPPPPAPGSGNACSSSTTTNSSSSTQSNKIVKKKKGGTYVQIDGKWILRPEAPPPLEEAPPGTKEDRQRQWREYRQAMKPFKNREFHNWKRTVQRLSKLPRDQLDERQLERLQKAEEYIGAHKAMLTIKHAEQWVQQSNQKTGTAPATGQGQVFVRKQANPIWEKKDNQNTFQRAGPAPARKQQIFGTGRAIKGGITGDLGVMPPLVAGPVPPPPPPIGPP
ncbi:hypothetical protein KR222_006135, partial [Zaprionus bogoriensis]